MKEQDLLEFENSFTKEYLVFFERRVSVNKNYTDWLTTALRPLRKNKLEFKTDYITTNKVKTTKEAKDLITFLNFLMYIKNIDYKMQFLVEIWLSMCYFLYQ